MDKKAFSQNSFQMVLEDSINLDSINAGNEFNYTDNILCRWNEKNENLIAIVYYAKDKSFRLKIFKINKDTGTICLLNSTIPSMVSLHPNESESKAFLHRIQGVIFSSNILWIQYDTKFITKVTLNVTYNAIDNIIGFNVREEMSHSFKYIFPRFNFSDNVVGGLLNSKETKPEITKEICFYKFTLKDTLIDRINCVQNFDSEYWQFYHFNPAIYKNETVFIISPLSHDFYQMNLLDLKVEKSMLHNLGKFKNDMKSINEIRATTTNGYLIRRMFPTNFFYRFCGSSKNSLFIYRELLINEKNYDYFIDKITLKNGEWSYETSINLEEAIFKGINLVSTKWQPQSIPTSEFQINDHYFARIAIEPTNFDHNLIGSYNTVLFQVFKMQ